ncbi:MAG TPA: aminotransferase class III-fold pyridoxal phosphate-dependent enzyme [Armatimonadota bacterium]|nr:aminotransferase class III-fold pyridoxal phosphate-dependent enzyme [Armatimonadota bacterium]
MEETTGLSEAEQVIEETIEKYAAYVNPTLANLMRFAGFGDVEASAHGTKITDYSGNEYIDCLGGYGVFSLGHRHAEVVAAVQEQLECMPLSSKIFFNKPLADLAELLAEITPGRLQYSFICNSGAEAMEGALKAARIYTKRTEFISTIGGFHGKSMGSLSATGRDLYKSPFQPLIPGFKHVPFGDAKAVESTMTPNTAAVIVEPIQGEGGIRVPPDDYLPRLREICTQNGSLLVADEVQTGMGRTGKMFACEHWGVEPDIMTLAKALGGGVMPIGAFIGTPEIWEAMFRENPLMHSSTFGGNPLACRAAIAAIHATRFRNLPGRAARLGEYFIGKLREIKDKHPKALTEVRGLGLMIGVEFTHEDIGELVIGGLARRGVIAAYTLNNPKVIRFEPPLIITEEEIDAVATAFDEAIAEALEMVEGIV